MRRSKRFKRIFFRFCLLLFSHTGVVLLQWSFTSGLCMWLICRRHWKVIIIIRSRRVSTKTSSVEFERKKKCLVKCKSQLLWLKFHCSAGVNALNVWSAVNCECFLFWIIAEINSNSFHHFDISIKRKVEDFKLTKKNKV
jgi:hypothetical protein